MKDPNGLHHAVKALLQTSIFPSGTSHHPSELLPNPPRRELLNHLPSDTLGSNRERIGNVFLIYRRLVPAELASPHAARGNPAAKGFPVPMSSFNMRSRQVQQNSQGKALAQVHVIFGELVLLLEFFRCQERTPPHQTRH